MRIYVGGLGSRVQVSDLEKTFTSPHLGAVQSVEIIRTKGRSFAYLEFLPASEKGLVKLFSTYNGCMWKGGKLKIEKAKENYICRLRREWTEDAELETKLSGQNVDADESVHALLKPKKDEDIEKMQLKMFFPKLRKIKAIPLKGTGKHKYSFQRVEVPPLPVHFCDCEDHSVPLEPAKRNHSGLLAPSQRNNTNDDHEVDNYGVNEEELNMMKSILDKLLEKEIHSEIVPSKAEPTEEVQHDASVVDKWQVDDNEEDQVSDEDNLVINIVRKSSKKDTSFEDWGLKSSSANQDTLVSELKCLSNTNPKMQGVKSANHVIDKKRKQSVREDKSNDTVPSKKKERKGDSHDRTDDQVVVNTKHVDKESDNVQLSCDVASSKKRAWKALVSEGSTAFNISDILTNHVSDLATEPCSNENDGRQDQTTEHEDSEELFDVLSANPTASKDLLARGASWKQKSSWLQLVADANASAFSLSQILPNVTFQEQASQQFNDIDFFSNSKGEKQHSFVHKDDKFSVEDIGEPQVPTPRIPNEDVLTKGQNNDALDGQQLNSYSEEKVEVKESSASMLGTYPVPDNRAMGDIVISETCPFMKSSASRKEWEKSKAALSGSHKRKGKGKESIQD